MFCVFFLFYELVRNGNLSFSHFVKKTEFRQNDLKFPTVPRYNFFSQKMATLGREDVGGEDVKMEDERLGR